LVVGFFIENTVPAVIMSSLRESYIVVYIHFKGVGLHSGVM